VRLAGSLPAAPGLAVLHGLAGAFLPRAAGRIPLLKFRDDPLMVAVLGWRGVATWLRNTPRLVSLGGSFGPMARPYLQDPFLLRWIDMLCFLISGLPLRVY